MEKIVKYVEERTVRIKKIVATINNMVEDLDEKVIIDFHYIHKMSNILELIENEYAQFSGEINSFSENNDDEYYEKYDTIIHNFDNLLNYSIDFVDRFKKIQDGLEDIHSTIYKKKLLM